MGWKSGSKERRRDAGRREEKGAKKGAEISAGCDLGGGVAPKSQPAMAWSPPIAVSAMGRSRARRGTAVALSRTHRDRKGGITTLGGT
ncbi:hypothetical protein CCACVL1_27707 [Corchorus capsularis]|uniref:Uncharacterized protein n=1 Tax=Corchorus capsularis TaxID=210143 RepID=A0A1R3G9E6_COCAP|nr:hypothetical protein CCACVL1_27707 [Corchorus capsularis]